MPLSLVCSPAYLNKKQFNDYKAGCYQRQVDDMVALFFSGAIRFLPVFANLSQKIALKKRLVYQAVPSDNSTIRQIEALKKHI